LDKRIKILLEAFARIDSTKEILKEIADKPGIHYFIIANELNEAAKEIRGQLKALIWAEFCTKHGIEA